MVSLVPFSTAWVADTQLAAVPVFVYAAVLSLPRGFLHDGCSEKTANGWLHVRRGADELKGTMRTTRIQ